MAINEQDREDLLRDGRAMPVRGESLINDAVVVVGFRAGGQVSLYCGPDPVYQFNEVGQIRRVFYQGQRYAAEGGRLMLLSRSTKGGRVSFESQSVADALRHAILADLQTWLAAIAASQAADRDAWKVDPKQREAFFDQLAKVIDVLSKTIQIANQPNASSGPG